jgi:hypothetical protein
MEALLEAKMEPESEFLRKLAATMREKHSSLFKVTTSRTRLTLTTIPDREMFKIFVSEQPSGKIGLLYHYHDPLSGRPTRTKSNHRPNFDKLVSTILLHARR